MPLHAELKIQVISMWNISKPLMTGAFLLALTAFVVGTYYGQYREQQRVPVEMVLTDSEALEGEEAPPKEPAEILVYVAGEVEHPGVYHFPPGSRVYEGVNKACPKETAELRYLELARVMVDEETILIPSQNDDSLSVPSIALKPGISASGKININRATAEELDEHLDGIGPTLAQRIVDYRNEHGLFRRTEDLQNVNGIGEKRFAEMRDQVDVK